METFKTKTPTPYWKDGWYIVKDGETEFSYRLHYQEYDNSNPIDCVHLLVKKNDEKYLIIFPDNSFQILDPKFFSGNDLDCINSHYSTAPFNVYPLSAKRPTSKKLSDEEVDFLYGTLLVKETCSTEVSEEKEDSTPRWEDGWYIVKEKEIDFSYRLFYQEQDIDTRIKGYYLLVKKDGERYLMLFPDSTYETFDSSAFSISDLETIYNHYLMSPFVEQCSFPKIKVSVETLKTEIHKTASPDLPFGKCVKKILRIFSIYSQN